MSDALDFFYYFDTCGLVSHGMSDGYLSEELQDEHKKAQAAKAAPAGGDPSGFCTIFVRSMENET